MTTVDPILVAVQRTWGYSSLRPLQREAIEAGLARRDALVVMPTGGGKSLCYQVPPLVTGRLCVVVSPLIALMQDQVDGLRLAGYPAAALHSNIAPEQAADTRRRVAANELRLLLVAPERLLAGDFASWLRSAAGRNLDAFAIDEAHCISQWGHDFRPEYRRLAELRRLFPDAPLHAYTATATPRVRQDIVDQLQLREPLQLVGRFDRANLTYRVLPRVNLVDQATEVLSRHEGRAAIIYCISRKDTESLAEALRAIGVDARAYHAGMTGQQRERVQSDFTSERLNVVVATVAFGMGIDRSDVRCVIHAAMPKTIEHYQQETGRAGRDGLPAECVLLYSGADLTRWKTVMTRSAEEAGLPPDVNSAQFELMEHMHRLCTGGRCRHRALSEYFGQAYEPPTDSGGCGACDVCLGELAEVPGATDIARKILSCVARVGQNYGAKHITEVLLGKSSPRILEKSHHTLSTFGLLAGAPREAVLSYINQLVDEGVLEREGAEYPVLRLNAQSKLVMRNERQVTLVDPPRVRKPAAGAASDLPLSAVESRLFDALRALRRQLAEELGVPPYVIFNDATLQEMARVRPGSSETFICIRGIGQSKLAQFGDRFVAFLRQWCADNALALDAEVGSRPRRTVERSVPERRSPIPAEAARLFDDGQPIDRVAESIGRARSTVADYLVEWVRARGPASINPWVDEPTYRAVADARDQLGDGPLRPLYEKLGGRVPYETIKVVLMHRQVAAPPA